MYKLGHRTPHRQKLYAGLILLAAGLVIASFWMTNRLLQPQTELHDSEGVVRHVEAVKPATKTVQTAVFSIKIPSNWKSVASQLIPAAPYAWRGIGSEDAARSLELYVDTIPETMAVNKLLPLRATGDKVVPSDSISDNCVNFTDSTQADKATGKILAKWSGVNFYCDAGNYLRNVVGTGSPGTINSVTLSGTTAGTHRFFFVFTDHSAEPDYTVFTNMLNTFVVR